MQDPNDAILSELTIAEWLKAFRHITAPAVGKRGPIRPGSGVSEMVPGPYPDWHYVALALRNLLETVDEQKSQIDKLVRRVDTLEQTR